MKKILSILTCVVVFFAAQIRACPTCIGATHKENTPAFFSRDFYQPGQVYAQAQSKTVASAVATLKSPAQPFIRTVSEQEEDDAQAASMAAALEK